MGMHAMDALDMCAMHEAEWDSYACGDVNDNAAYEAGIIDAQGYADQAQLDRVLDRNPIPTLDNLNNQLSHATKDLVIAGIDNRVPIARGELKSALNEAAKVNLRKAQPTCNECGHSMQPRDGVYGKFYFCANRCESQKCVSDKYWQSVRIK